MLREKELALREKAQKMAASMTLQEKLAQMTMHTSEDLFSNGKLDWEKARELFGKQGIGALQYPRMPVKQAVDAVNQLHEFFQNTMRVYIPPFFIEEALHGVMNPNATIFPQSISMACAWNCPLIREISGVISKEAQALGITQVLCPDLDLCRDPRWGRIEETFGEDAFLTSSLGTAYVQGIQYPEENETPQLIATLKHFAVHGSPEGGVNLSPVASGERLMQEYYLKPFREVIQNCDPLSVMPAYSEIDGIPCSASKKLLTKILREELGFSGYTISDYGALQMLQNFHKIADSAGAAGKRALHAGMDLEAPLKWAYGEELEKSAQEPQVMRAINQAVERILYVKLKAQLWDKTRFDPEDAAQILQNPKHKKLARQAAQESIVLLKNRNGVLPIDPADKKIGVFGPNADAWQLGDYTVDRRCKTPLQAIQERYYSVEYAEGCGIFDGSTAGLQQAVEIASQCDILILCVGGSSTISYGIGWGQDSGDVKTCGEGFDVSDLGLAGLQRNLAEQMIQTGKPVIVVHINGRPLSDSWVLEHCDAFIEMGYAGQEGADALADILFGKCSPSGRLTISVPKSVGQIPVYYNHQPSARGFYHQPGTPENPGRDYVFSDTLPLHSFGSGLSYTEFLYSDLQAGEDKEEKKICVSVTVKNIGKMQAQETVQVYLRDVVASVARPVKELKAFSKLLLCPGESRRVQLEIPFRELAFLDEDNNWCIEPGAYEIYVSNLTYRLELEI